MTSERLLAFWERLAKSEAAHIYSHNELPKRQDSYIARRTAQLQRDYETEHREYLEDIAQDKEDERIIKEMKRWRS